jgi:hypothetical protein
MEEAKPHGSLEQDHNKNRDGSRDGGEKGNSKRRQDPVVTLHCMHGAGKATHTRLFKQSQVDMHLGHLGPGQIIAITTSCQA